MLKVFAIAAVCIGFLAVFDQQFYAGQHVDQVLKMLWQIAHSFNL